MALDDHEVAGLLAWRAGRLLREVRAAAFESEESTWSVQDAGDRRANEFIVDALARLRPDDAVLSEEGGRGRADRSAARLWVIDPLDGTVDYGQPGNPNWAVHVALSLGGEVGPAAVAVPEHGRVYTTALCPIPAAEARPRRDPVVISNRSTAGLGHAIAEELGGELLVRGSAGVKAMAVVGGTADIYIHGTGLYDWDAAAPAGVAAAAGLHVSDLYGSALRFDQPEPVVPGLLICAPRWADAVLTMLGR